MTLQTTTFKGARYLVKFHDPIEWASTESYEAIEAVKHNAYTYISKQPVPVGVQIDNEDFWLLWADPNAQMEELRQLVAGYVDDVTALDTLVDAINDALPIADFDSVNTVKNAIEANNDKMEMLKTGEMQIISPDMNGTITLIKCPDFNCLIDTGQNATALFRAFMNENLGTEKLDVIVISHFHDDHDGNMLTALEYCDADTDIYIQMPVTRTEVTDKTYYDTGYATLSQALTAANLKQCVTPQNAQGIEYGDVIVTFYNTDSDYEDDYIYKSDNSITIDSVSMNNYSLVTEIEYNNSKYLNSSDIETPAQVNICDLISGGYAIAMLPHHGQNNSGYYKFFDKCNEQYTQLCTAKGNDHSDPFDMYTLETKYVFRYSTQIRPQNIVHNQGKAFECVLNKNVVKSISGMFASLLIDRKSGNLNSNKRFDSYFPIATKYDITNPFLAYYYTLEDYLFDIAELPFAVNFRIPVSDNIKTNMTAYQTIIDLYKQSNVFSDISIDDNYIFDIATTTRGIEITSWNSLLASSKIEVYYGFNSNTLISDYVKRDLATYSTRKTLGLTGDTDTPIVNAYFHNIVKYNTSFCLTAKINDTNVNVPCVKISATSFSGCAPFLNGIVVVSGTLSSTDTTSFSKIVYYDLVNGTQTNGSIAGVISNQFIA